MLSCRGGLSAQYGAPLVWCCGQPLYKDLDSMCLLGCWQQVLAVGCYHCEGIRSLLEGLVVSVSRYLGDPVLIGKQDHNISLGWVHLPVTWTSCAHHSSWDCVHCWSSVKSSIWVKMVCNMTSLMKAFKLHCIAIRVQVMHHLQCNFSVVGIN